MKQAVDEIYDDEVTYVDPATVYPRVFGFSLTVAGGDGVWLPDARTRHKEGDEFLDRVSESTAQRVIVIVEIPRE